MEEFKEFNQLLSPDDRNLYFCVTNTSTGESRSLTLDDIYSSVNEINLLDVVPDDIQSQFNIAKNLAVYSWFSYPLHQISEMKAFSTVEQALKCCLGKHKYGFKGLLKKAVQLGMLKDQGYRHISTPNDSSCIEYVSKLPDIMPSLRNSLAHGGTTLHPDSITNLQICCDTINQLYKNGSSRNPVGKKL